MLENYEERLKKAVEDYEDVIESCEDPSEEHHEYYRKAAQGMRRDLEKELWRHTSFRKGGFLNSVLAWGMGNRKAMGSKD